jgi:hypothetical protein
MDPVSAIVAALAAGASLALKETAASAVKDAYNGIKTLIKTRFSAVDVELLERNPQSPGRQEAIKEELESAGAGTAQELLAAARMLLDRIAAEAPEQAAAAGVDLGRVKAANIAIRDVVSSGTGVVARDVEAGGDLIIEAVRAGGAGPGKKPV